MMNRPDYIEKISKFINVPIIKILTGIRRCGKSTIFEMVQNELKSKSIDNSHIITRNYTNIEFSGITAKEMIADIKKDIVDKNKYYIFLDEIQKVENFEEVVNSLRASTNNISIFITGSNSKLLSQELSSVLSGRYVLFNIFPFIV